MTVARRLATVEVGLSPTELVLRWLEEVQGAGDLETHLAWLIEQPEAAWPLVRLPREADHAVRTSLRGQPAAAIHSAVRQAVADVVFRVCLITRLNAMIDAAIERVDLVGAFMIQRLNVIGLEADLPEGRRGSGGYHAWLQLATSWLVGLRATEAARREIERRYLAGHDGLFPPSGNRWAERLAEAERIVFLGIRTVELDAPEALDTEVPLPEPTAEAVAQIADHLIDGARLAALTGLGEHAAAQVVARRWLRLPSVESLAGLAGDCERSLEHGD